MSASKLIIGLYGRGGQGVITAAKIICKAAILENKNLFTMLIPHYGPERTGGPVKALVEISDKPIKDRSSLKQPTHLLIFDKSLFQTELEKDVMENKDTLNIFFNATAAEIECLSRNHNYLNKRKITLVNKSPHLPIGVLDSTGRISISPIHPRSPDTSGRGILGRCGDKIGNEDAPLNILMLRCFFEKTKIASLYSLNKAVSEVLKKNH